MTIIAVVGFVGGILLAVAAGLHERLHVGLSATACAFILSMLGLAVSRRVVFNRWQLGVLAVLATVLFVAFVRLVLH
ncbi:hypothetical protein [Tahibacter soli]|uniref:Uncharacterized protein n=1 Tax=Tahibacter soli TaxID=2983605 RepID=A0A9X3YN87_9GAMM|nr:hypothetical protein [Tahibacter soli]MDC8013868.1 hypothetical protein [Tahibacter soli]